MKLQPTSPKVLRTLSEEEGLKIFAKPNHSVSIILCAARIERGRPELLLVREYDSHWGETWKMPSGKMLPGETIFQTVERKLPIETGLKATRVQFCYGAELSSTVEARHSKITVFLTDLKGALLTQKAGKILERKWFRFEEAEKRVNLAQLIAFSHVVETAKSLSMEYASALLNHF